MNNRRQATFKSSIRVWLLVLLGCAWGCDRVPPIRYHIVVLHTPKQLDNKDQQKQAISADIERFLGQVSSARYVSSREAAEYVIEVRMGDVHQLHPEKPPQRTVSLNLKGVGSRPGFSVIGYGQRPEDLAYSTLSAFTDAWHVVGRQRALIAGSASKLAQVLGDEDPRMRLFALDQLARHRPDKIATTIARYLGEERNPKLMLRAIGVLAELGDESAVPTLIDLTRQQSPEFVKQIVFALGAIGGRTAQGFLVTLAGGHPVQGVRDAARIALSELPGQDAPPSQ